MNKITQFFSLVLLTVIAIAGFLYFGGQQDIEGLKKSVAPTASLYPEAKSISEKLNFINDQSESLNLSEISQDKWVLMYFGYTSCPDVCAIDLSRINLSFEMMENKDKLQVVFISVDPARDIGVLDQFAGAFNSSFLGLTAHSHELETISKSLGVYHQVVEVKNWLNRTTALMRITIMIHKGIKRLTHMNTIMLTTQLAFCCLILT